MSLREQMLKAGLATKKQAKKAANAAKREKKKKGKGPQKEPPKVADNNSQKERDRELNRVREEKRIQHEKTHQARNIISSHSLDEFKANQPYYLVLSNHDFKSYVTSFADS